MTGVKELRSIIDEQQAIYNRGWNDAIKKAVEIAGQRQAMLTNGGAINACKSIAAELRGQNKK